MDNNNYVPTQPAPQTPPPAPQQQGYPQQPYGQQGYPQQPYTPQPPRESIIQRLYGKSESLLGSLMTWVSVILYILVPVAVLLGLIMGIVNGASGGVFSGFSGTAFLSRLVEGFFHAAIYAFMATLLAYAKNRLDK